MAVQNFETQQQYLATNMCLSDHLLIVIFFNLIVVCQNWLCDESLTNMSFFYPNSNTSHYGTRQNDAADRLLFVKSSTKITHLKKNNILEHLFINSFKADREEERERERERERGKKINYFKPEIESPTFARNLFLHSVCSRRSARANPIKLYFVSKKE